MDDDRITNEMTLEGIARRLDTIQADLTTVKQDVAVIKTDVAGLKTDVAGLKTAVGGLTTDVGGLMYEVKAGFDRVDSELNDARIRDEELRGLMKFGLEAREALRESITARFDTTERKQDEAITLLKDVIKARQTEPSGEHRPRPQA